jgi:hypothetical protein
VQAVAEVVVVWDAVVEMAAVKGKAAREQAELVEQAAQRAGRTVVPQPTPRLQRQKQELEQALEQEPAPANHPAHP